ncbi:hypothetical protein C5C26_17060, partial [Rathayibacter sp. AY2B1]
MTRIGTTEPVPRLWRDEPPASAGSHTAVCAIPEPSTSPRRPPRSNPSARTGAARTHPNPAARRSRGATRSSWTPTTSPPTGTCWRVSRPRP